MLPRGRQSWSLDRWLAAVPSRRRVASASLRALSCDAASRPRLRPGVRSLLCRVPLGARPRADRGASALLAGLGAAGSPLLQPPPRLPDQPFELLECDLGS